MFDNYAVASGTLADLREVNRRLTELMPKVRNANEAFSDAARPLKERPELDPNERREVARRLRAAEQEWEAVAPLTVRAFAAVESLCNHSPPSPNGNGSATANPRPQAQ